MNASIRLACLVMGLSGSTAVMATQNNVIRFEGSIVEPPCPVGVEQVTSSGAGPGVRVNLSGCALRPTPFASDPQSHLVHPVVSTKSSEFFIPADGASLLRITLSYP
ncbi:hypothetical protein [Pseudomonas sp. R5(2019)]|uniref:hypothetical protein n=1 Tax=Pseudomonas sp. R5(2019) TaxID=2697566 RepID=UPI00141312DF|nr:hypothetical protein [Pseudomonas sp. R5(2019)]NBA95730.1 hypothetical protein [Pseudomonas sp. R5(2019)]